jgi:hypothetical protein
MHRLYREHNIRLGEVVGRDLSHWNTCGDEAPRPGGARRDREHGLEVRR